MAKPFFVYMLHCADGSYYLGHTDELERRVAQHQAGEIEGYTHERRPVELVWTQETATRDEALAAERRLKGWSRAKKDALIRGDWVQISRLARSRGGVSEGSFDRLRTNGVAEPSATTAPSSTTNPGSTTVPGSTPVPSAAPVRPELVEGPVHREPVEGSPDHAAGPPSTGSGRSKTQAHSERALGDGVLSGDRRALAKAITLIESTRADHRAQADALLDALLPASGRSLRLGISGAPGVGKSTFIEVLGLFLIERGQRVAVLAVDPSSSVSGGSILGDKTRMERLSVLADAFIRPSPTAGALGGVAEHTREALLLCEAAGFDVVIVETVGVGQSETTVAGMTDLFVLLQLPNAGDDLQAIKRGVMELADIVAINKADLDEAAATRAQAQITSAIRIFGFHGKAHAAAAPVLRLSALKAEGIDAFWATVEAEAARRRASGAFDARREQQRRAWLWDIVHAGLRADFERNAAVREALPRVLAQVDAARTAPTVAARALLNLFEKN